MARSGASRPAALCSAAGAFERWRRRRTRRRIPEALWKRATLLARRYGVNRTARALGLNYADLKRRAERPGSGGAPARASAPSFVEVLPLSGAAECVVEFERPDGGKMRIHHKGSSAPDLADLSRAFWGVRA